ncbi:carbon-nitrogen hydrolase family protein [Amnibacterium endophyticum]|uniref:Carbon-nitrogen hydrolase family protein n=1 Tax=Amnibacterium endophyticum TaxID=2109337 RepID=A0ABW4LDX5_9MICO
MAVLAAVAAHLGRDVARALPKVEGILEDARAAGADLVVLPDAALGGYLSDLGEPDAADLPAPLAVDGPEVARIRRAAGRTVVCVGLAEAVPGDPRRRWNTAVCCSAERVWGVHRKVHRPLGESRVYAAGDRFAAFDTPVGRVGMLTSYDKTFPEAARALADDGAVLLACLGAWPASTTDRAAALPQDRQSRLFDLYDLARAAENQVVLVSSNQTGVQGRLRFLGQAKVVGPGGDVLARTGVKGGMAVAEVDVPHEVGRARRRLHHLAERVPAAYGRRP